MTGPNRGGTGGAGWGGVFTAFGDASASYFDRLDKERSFAEQQRQFNEQQANVQRQLKSQEDSAEVDRFDRLDKSLVRMEQDLADRGEYMTEEQRSAYTSFIQSGRTATQTYWASGDKAGFDSFTEQYGPGKSWGEDAMGNPITLESINASVYANKPRIIMENRIKTSAGETMAAMVSTVLTDPNATPEMKDWAQGMADGKFTNFPQALAGALAGNALGPSMLKQSLTKTGITGKSLAGIEDVLKLLGEGGAKNPDGSENADYKYLQSLLADPANRKLIDDARKATEYDQSGKFNQAATIGGMQIDRTAFDNDVARTDDARKRLMEGRADRDDISRLVAAGDVGALKNSYAQYKEVYVKDVLAQGLPEPSEEDIRNGFDAAIGRATGIQGQQDSIMQAQTTIMSNSASSSTIELDQARIIFDAVKPYLAANSAAGAKLENLLKEKSITEAKMAATFLPALLELRDQADRTALLQQLADAPGALGVTALQALQGKGIISEEQLSSLVSYAQVNKELRDQGINVQTAQGNAAIEQAKASWWSARMSGRSTEALMAKGYVDKAADAAIAGVDAQQAQSTVDRLVAQGQAVDAYQVGLSGNKVTLERNATAQEQAKYEGQLIELRREQGIPETQINAELNTLRAQGAQAIVNTLVAEGQQGQARRAGEVAQAAQISQGLTTIQEAQFDRLMIAARVKAGIPLAQANTELRELKARGVTAYVTTLIQEGIIPSASDIGRTQAAATIASNITTADRSRYESDLIRRRTAAGVPDATIQAELQNLRTMNSNDYVTYLMNEGIIPYAKDAGSAQARADIANNLTALDRNNYERDLIAKRKAAGVPDATIQGELNKLRSMSSQDYVTYLMSEGVIPYAGELGARGAEADLKDLQLRRATANNALKLIPLSFKKERQDLFAAIEGGRLDEAVAILKRGNLVRDDMLSTAAGMQSLAELDRNGALADPKTGLAFFKNNPGMRQVYLAAVKARNEDRTFANDLAVVKSNGRGTSGLTVGNLNSSINSMQGEIKGIYNRPDIKAARDRISKAAGISIANDAITSMSNIVRAIDDPAIARQYAADVAIVRGALKEAQPILDKMDAYKKERDAMVFGQPNGGSTSFVPGDYPTGPAKSYANVPKGNVTGQGGVVVQRGGANVPASTLTPQEVTKQVTMTVDHYVGKIKQQGTANPWDNAGGPVRAYNGMGPKLPNQISYVNDIKAAYDAKPWIGAIGSASGGRKNELAYINSEVDRVARAKGVDPDVIKAIMWNESVGWQAHIPSSDGKGGGLGQVTGYYAPRGGYKWETYKAPAAPVAPPAAARPAAQPAAAQPPAPKPAALPKSAINPGSPIKPVTNTGVPRTGAGLATPENLPLIPGVTTKYSSTALKEITRDSSYQRLLLAVDSGDAKSTTTWANGLASNYLWTRDKVNDPKRIEAMSADLITMAQQHVQVAGQYGVNTRSPAAAGPQPISNSAIVKAVPGLNLLGTNGVKAMTDIKGQAAALRRMGDTPALDQSIIQMVTGWMGVKDATKMNADQASKAQRIHEQVKAYILGK